MCNENYTSPFVKVISPPDAVVLTTQLSIFKGDCREMQTVVHSFHLPNLYSVTGISKLPDFSFFYFLNPLSYRGPRNSKSYWVNSSMDTQKQGPGVKVKCKSESHLFSAVSLVHHRTQRMLSFFLAASHLSWVPIPHRGTVVRPKRRHSHLARLLRSRDREERPLVCGFGAWWDLVLAQQSLCLTQWPVVVIGDAFFT